MKKTPKMAIAYLRVSTDTQAPRYGFELQEAAIRAFASCKGYQITQVFSDVHSGMGERSFTSRPGAVAAASLSHSTGWPILVDGLDRWSRNLEVLERVIRSGSQNVINVRAGVGVSRAATMGTAARAQREGELIGQSTKKALQERKARGVLLGNRTNLKEAQAKGLAQTKARVEKQTVELTPVIAELRQSGSRTAKAIAEGLNDLGYRTARHGPWKEPSVRRLLKRVDAAVEPQLLELQPTDLRSGACQQHPLWGAF